MLCYSIVLLLLFSLFFIMNAKSIACSFWPLNAPNEMSHMLRPNKKIPVFRVTGPYLNLMVKPRICFRFSG